MKNPLVTIGRFYADGFRNMTSGRTLWVIILVKLFVMFFILKLFFFPDFLSRSAPKGDKEGYVSRELVMRMDGGAVSASPTTVSAAQATADTDCNQQQYSP